MWTRSWTVALFLVLFLAVIGSKASAVSTYFDPPPSGVSFYVGTSGGLLDPLSADSSIATIPNTGRIVISKPSGQVVFQKELSWSNTQDEVSNDNWTFDAGAQAPGLYNYCGQIDAGYGYAGWSSCEVHATELQQLFSFQRAKNVGDKLLIPMSIASDLNGQQVQVEVSWSRRHKYSWRRQGKVQQYQTTLGSPLSAGHALGRDQRVRVTFSFLNLSTVQKSGDEIHWLSVTDCGLWLRGRIGRSEIPPWESKSKLSKPDFSGQKITCSTRALPL